MCFPIFDLIKFTCFGSTFSYHKEILNPPPAPHPHAKQFAGRYPQPARVNPPRAGL